MMSEVLKIDEIDKQIINLIQDQPSLTHTQIAKKV
ncbi:MAG: AsnC family protein, partial [Promethearchaeota archaeon]